MNGIEWPLRDDSPMCEQVSPGTEDAWLPSYCEEPPGHEGKHSGQYGETWDDEGSTNLDEYVPARLNIYDPESCLGPDAWAIWQDEGPVMSNRRKLRPHEVAKRDQRAAEMKERVGRGQVVIWVDDPGPGTPCSYCDCPLTPDSPHRQPGYVCDKPCSAGTVYLVLVLGVPGPQPVPLCSRHYDDWCADFAGIVRPAAIQFAEPWAGHDYEGPPALWTPAT